MDPGSVSARRNIQIPEENRFSYRDKSSLQLHRDRNILRSRKINSALPIPCNPQEFISMFLRARPHTHTHTHIHDISPTRQPLSLSSSFGLSFFPHAESMELVLLFLLICLTPRVHLRRIVSLSNR